MVKCVRITLYMQYYHGCLVWILYYRLWVSAQKSPTVPESFSNEIEKQQLLPCTSSPMATPPIEYTRKLTPAQAKRCTTLRLRIAYARLQAGMFVNPYLQESVSGLE